MTEALSGELSSLLSGMIRKRQGYIRFDLSEVRDIDVSSLNILVLFPGKIRRNIPDARLEIVHADDDVYNLFRMTGLDCAYKLVKGL